MAQRLVLTDLLLSNARLLGLPLPQQADEAASRAYVDAAVSGSTADWAAAPGSPGEVLNKPPLGTAAAEDVGVADGVCPLGPDGTVPSAHLPGFVDDLVEVADYASLPNPGSVSVMYVTLDDGKVYRWSGTQYVEIVGSPGSTDAVVEGTTNLYFTDERAQDATSLLVLHGDHVNISFAYDDANAKLVATVLAEPLVPATDTTLGGVMAGPGFAVDASGVLRHAIASLPPLP